MSSVSTFGAFTAARLGMYAAMKGLDVTGHNIGNINTAGYTRQSLDQISLRLLGTDKYYSAYDARVGTGVLCTGVSQLRDPYLDLRFRDEQASIGSMDAKLSALEDLKKIFDEVGKNEGEGVIQKQFNDLLTQLTKLSENVGDDSSDTNVRASASALVSMLNKCAKDIEKSEANQITGLKQDIETVNGILENIRDMNDTIRKSEVHGDSALELRDQRNLLLDQLSQYMDVDVSYGTEQIGEGTAIQKLKITLADGTPLIDGQYGTQIALQPPKPMENTNYDPAQTNPASPDFGEYLMPDPNNPNAFIGTNDPDLAAQVPNENYFMQMDPLTNRQGTTLPGSTALDLGHDALGGSLDATRQMLTAAGEFSLAGNPNSVTVRGVPYYKHALNALANKFATTLNEANQPYQVDPEGFYLDANGDKIADPDSADPTNPDFLSKNTPVGDLSATQKNALETNGKRLGGPLFSTSNAGNNTVGIDAKNISISNDWSTGAVKIVASAVGGDYSTSTQNSNILHIISLITGDIEYRPSDVLGADGSNTRYFEGNFQEMLVNTSATLANDVRETTTMLNNYVASALEIDNSRDSVSGVDLNDEAANMMQYQKSYAAACRMMTTIDEALDKLINNTGVVGR